jgi:hypothetical protein
MTKAKRGPKTTIHDTGTWTRLVRVPPAAAVTPVIITVKRGDLEIEQSLCVVCAMTSIGAKYERDGSKTYYCRSHMAKILVRGVLVRLAAGSQRFN